MAMGIIQNSCLLLLCLASCTVAVPLRKSRDTSSSTAAPTSPLLRWHQPCGGSSPVSNGPALPAMPAPPLGQSAFTIRMHITDNMNKVKDLRKRWVQERFHSDPEYINWIESQYIVYSSLPQEEHWSQFVGIQNAVNNMDEFFSQSYIWLAKIAVHLEEIRIDELASNTVFNQENVDAHMIQSAEDQLYVCMCAVHTLMTSRNLQLDQTIERDILETTFADPPGNSKTLRYNRDWIVFNHFLKLLTHLEKVYTELQQM
ncbi:uncharacterized protein LOC106160736 [Lingula anatina]|uniref:Uncharacterized protein LOC106160736 n=1 Tax=Lingula anatina TaxID=7574 RepID=A0A1S3I3P6_LINAN|nr:uncharacterized protein LOC106160736 [Lingula anatina]|eukprot:XP_013392858.1 uncharacterized protein LOC106160736 [Lingula anatina]